MTTEVETVETKTCTACGHDLPVTAFSPQPRGGYLSRCKECRNKAYREKARQKTAPSTEQPDTPITIPSHDAPYVEQERRLSELEDENARQEAEDTADTPPVIVYPTGGTPGDLIRTEGRVERMAGIFSDLNHIEAATASIVSELPRMTDDEVDQCLIYSTAMEKAGFVIRGACVLEVKARAKHLPGGRGNKDEAGEGARAAVARLAARLGKGASTLENDGRIFERFGQTLLGDEDPLDREYYVVALEAGDRAEEALELAQTKRDDPSYGVRAFRADVRAMIGGRQAKELEDLYWLSVPLDPPSRAALKRIMEQWQLSQAEAVRRAITQAANTGEE